MSLRDDLRKREESDFDLRYLRIMSVNLTITYSNSFHSVFNEKIKKRKKQQVGRKQTNCCNSRKPYISLVIHAGPQITHSLSPDGKYGSALVQSVLPQKYFHYPTFKVLRTVLLFKLLFSVHLTLEPLF